MRIVIARGRSQTRLYVLQVLYLSYRTKIIIVSKGCAMEILRLKIGGGGKSGGCWFFLPRNPVMHR